MADAFSNLLLSRLNDRELSVLRPHLVPVELLKGELFQDRPAAVRDLYFVEAGVLCVIASSIEGEGVAVALTGREGVGGALAVLGNPVMRHRLLVEIPGSAFRVDTDFLRRDRRSFPRLLELIDRYVQLLITQIAQSAVCNRYHSGRERLARWLLLTADEAGTTRLQVTHDVLAEIVGGARSLVTVSLGELRENGSIDTARGIVTVKRRRLAGQACECYGKVNRAIRLYQRD